jgi:ATP/maltotriose-dependent transcriptional regulator MalT
LVNDGQLTLASSRLAGLESKGVAANMLVGFIATRMGQPEISLQAYNEAIAQIGNTSMQANSYCSLGDAMVVAGEMEAAREYFQQCRDLDGELNYWAVAGLGG